MSRYSGAIAIQGGACNPIAVTNSIKRGIEEIRSETGSLLPTDLILADPALRLMVHQLAFMFHANDVFDQIGPEYFDLVAACEKLEVTQ